MANIQPKHSHTHTWRRQMYMFENQWLNLLNINSHLCLYNCDYHHPVWFNAITKVSLAWPSEPPMDPNQDHTHNNNKFKVAQASSLKPKPSISKYKCAILNILHILISCMSMVTPDDQNVKLCETHHKLDWESRHGQIDSHPHQYHLWHKKFQSYHILQLQDHQSSCEVEHIIEPEGGGGDSTYHDSKKKKKNLHP